MRKIRSRKLKKQKYMVIICSFLFLSIFSVGYAAFSTTISLNAKGNVHPTAKITVDELKDAVVTTGDGLYKEGNEYIFKGGNPANNLLLNNENWKIMGIDENNNLKIIRSTPISLPFDLGYSSSVSGIKNASSVSGTRYTNVSTDYCYQASGDQSSFKGCKVWGSKDTMRDSNGTLLKDTPGGAKMQRILTDQTTYDLPDDEAYLNVYLNGGTYVGNNIVSWYDTWSQSLPNNIKSKIMSNHSFNVGLVSNTEGQTLENDLLQEKALTWQGRVGIISITDYVRASTNSACTGVKAYISDSNCYNNSSVHNYLYKNDAQWSISPDSNLSSYRTWGSFASNIGSDYTLTAYFVRPVLYLSSDVKLSGVGLVGTEYEVK